MIESSAIVGMFSALKAAKEVVQNIIGLHDASLIQGKVVELNAKIIEAQESIFAVNNERTMLIQKVSEFEKRIIQLEAWETEKQKYELINISPTPQFGDESFVYLRKQDVDPAELSHKICANCYHRGQKSILQSEEFGRSKFLVCQSCGSDICIYGVRPVEHYKTPRKR